MDSSVHVPEMERGIEWSPDDEEDLQKSARLHSSPAAQQTDVEEVWFAVRFLCLSPILMLLIGLSLSQGCHCGVFSPSIANEYQSLTAGFNRCRRRLGERFDALFLITNSVTMDDPRML